MNRILCALLACLMLCACTAVPVPETTAGPQLKPGFYIPEDSDMADLLCYAELRENGTGLFSIMGQAVPIEWEPTKFSFGDMIASATENGFTLRESVTTEFTFVGSELPGGYLPDPPAPGVYAVSSVGFRGNTTFHSTLTRDNGYLELCEDKTGTLVFAEETYPFVMVGLEAVFDGWSMVLMAMPEPDSDMVVGYTTAVTCPVEADSIAFRLLEGE